MFSLREGQHGWINLPRQALAFDDLGDINMNGYSFVVLVLGDNTSCQ